MGKHYETFTREKVKNLKDIEVGVLFAPEIHFRLNGRFRHEGEYYSGAYTAMRRDGKILLKGEGKEEIVADGFTLTPEQFEEADFDLPNVTIGIHFHWEREENQKFRGALRLIDEGRHLTAINILPLEEYLKSVISSEMNAASPPELLKAHAVISRSWLLAQTRRKAAGNGTRTSLRRTEEEITQWFDREDHERFDVCADDHCQRYQGISRVHTPSVAAAIEATRGEVLTFGGEVCDARFSKCCGGATERFETAWEETPHPYLTKVVDNATSPATSTDLRKEEEAKSWIAGSPEAFCNTKDQKILSSVLNDYDQETHDFFRWTTSLTAEEATRLAKEKLGIDFGRVTALEPIERGVSGRVTRLRIRGTKKCIIIGKELLIRKALSPTHLYSSAFFVETEPDETGLPGRFTLRGAGWGHGVGLCQIGAAVMSARGYSYREILAHYFPGTKIEKIENLKLPPKE